MRAQNVVEGQAGAEHGYKGAPHGMKGSEGGPTVPSDELYTARARLIGAPRPPDLKNQTMDEICDSIDGIDKMRRYIAHLLIVDKHFDAGRGQAIDAILEKLERRLVKGGAQADLWAGHPLTIALGISISPPEGAPAPPEAQPSPAPPQETAPKPPQPRAQRSPRRQA